MTGILHGLIASYINKKFIQLWYMYNDISTDGSSYLTSLVYRPSETARYVAAGKMGNYPYYIGITAPDLTIPTSVTFQNTDMSVNAEVIDADSNSNDSYAFSLKSGYVTFDGLFAYRYYNGDNNFNVSKIKYNSANTVYVSGWQNTTNDTGWVAGRTTGGANPRRGVRPTSGSINAWNGLDIDSSSNVYACGYTNGTSYIVKYDSSLTVLWQRSFNAYRVYDLIHNPVTNNIHVLGRMPDEAGIITYDSSGNVVWQTKLNAGVSYYIKAAVDSEGNVYCLKDDKITVVKYNSSGVLQWQRKIVTFAGTPASISNIYIFDNDRFICVGHRGTPGVDSVSLLFAARLDGGIVNYGQFRWEAATEIVATSTLTSQVSTLSTTTTLTESSTTHTSGNVPYTTWTRTLVS